MPRVPTPSRNITRGRSRTFKRCPPLPPGFPLRSSLPGSQSSSLPALRAAAPEGEGGKRRMWRRRYRVSASPRLSHRRVVEFSPRSMATTTTALQTSCCQASSRRDNRSPPPLLSRPPPPPASLWKLLLGLDSSGWMAQKGAFAGHPHHHARMLGRTRPCKRRTTSLGGASAAPVSEAVTAFTDAAFHELFPSELPWPTFFAAGGVGRGRWVRSSYSVPSSTLSSCREKKKGGTAMLQHHHESLHHSSPASGALEKPLQ